MGCAENARHRTRCEAVSAEIFAMRYLVLVTDYDGTIATEGQAETAALQAIERLRMSGRRVMLLTGRRIDDLLAACPRLRLFDYVVAENGAVIYEPRTREQTLLGRPPPARFVKRLRELTENSLEVGKVVVSTSLPHRAAVFETIRQMGLELQLIFNRGAVMVLPTESIRQAACSMLCTSSASRWTKQWKSLMPRTIGSFLNVASAQ